MENGEWKVENREWEMGSYEQVVNPCLCAEDGLPIGH